MRYKKLLSSTTPLSLTAIITKASGKYIRPVRGGVHLNCNFARQAALFQGLPFKSLKINLLQKNTEVTVPFLLSSGDYGIRLYSPLTEQGSLTAGARSRTIL